MYIIQNRIQTDKQGMSDHSGLFLSGSLYHSIPADSCVIYTEQKLGPNPWISHDWAMGIGPPTGKPGPANQNEFFPTKGLYYRHKYSSGPQYATAVRWMDYLGKGEILTNRDVKKSVHNI